eukprot:1877738-Rhodomonas_salina.1
MAVGSMPALLHAEIKEIKSDFVLCSSHTTTWGEARGGAPRQGPQGRLAPAARDPHVTDHETDHTTLLPPPPPPRALSQPTSSGPAW